MENIKTLENTMNVDFRNWLQQDGYSVPFIHQTEKQCTTVIKVRKCDCFDYLYAQRNYKSNKMERNKSFEYAGMYYQKKEAVYDEQYILVNLLYGNTGNSKKNLAEELKQSVQSKVEAIINNDKNNLMDETLHDTKEIEDFTELYQSHAQEVARKYFLDRSFQIESLTFKCKYKPDEWTDESLMSYIVDPEAYVEQEVQNYINSNQQSMLDMFLYIELVQEEYKKIEEDINHSVHIIRDIMYGVKNSNAQTVAVTLCKDGKEFQFRTHAFSFRNDCPSNVYSKSIMEVKTRKEFEKIFGNVDGFKPEDIEAIKFRRDFLYLKKKSHDAQVEQGEHDRQGGQ